MIIDDRTCPNCNIELIIKVDDYIGSKTICPNCNQYIFINYDVYTDEQGLEEYPIWDIKCISEKEFNRLPKFYSFYESFLN